MDTDQPASPTPQFAGYDVGYFAQIAAHYNAVYTERIPAAPGGSTLFDNDKTHTVEHYRFTVQINGLECQYYTAEYDPMIPGNVTTMPVNNTKAKDTTYRYCVQVFKIVLPYDVESAYVESMSKVSLNNVLGLSSVAFIGAQQVKLEGDFNDFFRVYVPASGELNAFTILAPNVMVRMLNDAGNYNIEFAGNTVTFSQMMRYGTDYQLHFPKQSYENMFAFGVASAGEMGRAARPAQISSSESSQPMWKYFGMNSRSTAKWIFLIFGGIGGLIICSGVPFLWPVAVLAGILIYVRYRRLLAKRARLIRNWDHDATINTTA